MQMFICLPVCRLILRIVINIIFMSISCLDDAAAAVDTASGAYALYLYLCLPLLVFR